ncbi:internexin neuronal intermediate filament protein, alpha a [Chanos chanos]|uniref:Internexin neuronal intermediate filament protein, alpha a n=1 Tax=Chanos chanos TaxID=29144 RepID=A0A6J2VCG1_CHACN|nr:alpha-internexin [Chanos chanos]
MSYGSDQYMSSSYRKFFGDSPRFTASPSRLSNASSRSSFSSSGFRSQSLSRGASSLGYYRRSGRPSSFSPVPSDSVDFSQTSVINNEFKLIRTNEKEQLQGLNDRFAMFIEKVRNLEQQNKVLETELVTLRQRQNEPSRLANLYQQEIRDLRAQLEEANSEKSQILIERDNIDDDLQKLRGKYEDELRAREEAEQTLRSYKKDVDDATMVRLDLERKVESLLDEINFLRKVHDEEVTELTNMIQAAQISVEVELAKPDLTSALKEIRGQYEALASKNQQSAEEWYKTKFASLNDQATRTNEAMRASREEINDYRRQLQSKTIEIETLRGTNESLERQIREMEDAHNVEIAGFQETITHLDNELRNTKGEMARHLREYQDLLNVKMALDIEIAAYRKLLEGEETHFSSGMTFSGPSHAPSLNYGQPLRSYTGSSRNPKKEKDEEVQAKSKVAAQRETFEEIIEETILTKKVEKNDASDVN